MAAKLPLVLKKGETFTLAFYVLSGDLQPVDLTNSDIFIQVKYRFNSERVLSDKFKFQSNKLDKSGYVELVLPAEVSAKFSEIRGHRFFMYSVIWRRVDGVHVRLLEGKLLISQSVKDVKRVC